MDVPKNLLFLHYNLYKLLVILVTYLDFQEFMGNLIEFIETFLIFQFYLKIMSYFLGLSPLPFRIFIIIFCSSLIARIFIIIQF